MHRYFGVLITITLVMVFVSPLSPHPSPPPLTRYSPSPGTPPHLVVLGEGGEEAGNFGHSNEIMLQFLVLSFQTAVGDSLLRVI